MCDTFGPRYRGTPNLEAALNWILQSMKTQGFQNVHPEAVSGITHWVRGTEYLRLIEPRVHSMAMLGLGNSVGTESIGITAEVFVVSSFDDLYQNSSKAKGKIVLFNAPFVSYGKTVQYRVRGATEAAKYGALAALVRSITPFSLYTPHTGGMQYSSSVKIPTAAITVEDAEMMARMQARGQKIRVHLYMEASTLAPLTSFNVIGEIVGATNPTEVVVLGGHTDSWDVGTGCVDDGGGIFSAWEAVNIINKLISSNVIPRPRRTIRVVGWVDEELSGKGATSYFNDHKSELKNHVMAMESDGGNFTPFGFGFSGLPEAQNLVTQIGNVLLAPIGVGNISSGGADSDTYPLVDAGIPGGSLKSGGFGNDDNYYFFFHHTNADSFTAINHDGIRRSVAAFATMAYVIADMEQRLPANITTVELIK